MVVMLLYNNDHHVSYQENNNMWVADLNDFI